MSDLELVLRHRLQSVKKGVAIGTQVLQDAQDQRGLSNERLARKLNISERTWRRWKDEGEVPSYHLPTVARELGLQINQTRPVSVSAGPPGDQMAALQAEVAEIREELLGRVDGLESLLREVLAGLQSQGG